MGRICQKKQQVLRACGAQDDMLARFAGKWRERREKEPAKEARSCRIVRRTPDKMMTNSKPQLTK